MERGRSPTMKGKINQEEREGEKINERRNKEETK